MCHIYSEKNAFLDNLKNIVWLDVIYLFYSAFMYLYIGLKYRIRLKLSLDDNYNKRENNKSYWITYCGIMLTISFAKKYPYIIVYSLYFGLNIFHISQYIIPLTLSHNITNNTKQLWTYQNSLKSVVQFHNLSLDLSFNV